MTMLKKIKEQERRDKQEAKRQRRAEKKLEQDKKTAVSAAEQN